MLIPFSFYVLCPDYSSGELICYPGVCILCADNYIDAEVFCKNTDIVI
jgi:hypothetical protein